MKLHNLAGRTKTGYTTWGCMWPQGAVTEETEFSVLAEDGSAIPSQSRTTAFWPDHSVKWTAHTADGDKMTASIQVLPRENGEKEQGQQQGIRQWVTEAGDSVLEAGILRLEYRTKNSGYLFHRLYVGGRLAAENAASVLLLEEPLKGENGRGERRYEAEITDVQMEDQGPLQVVLKYRGIHRSAEGREKIPFVIRMKLGYNSGRLDFVHTFYYDGEENRDFLKGIGVEMSVPVEGAFYNRHIKAEGDWGCFHEAAAELLCWRPRLPQEIYGQQMKGQKLTLEGENKAMADQALGEMPFWDTYEICQDRVNHFGVKKKTKGENHCFLDCLDGERSRGGAAIGGENGSVMFSIRDFWEKYPSGYTFEGLTEEKTRAVVWLWAPGGGSMDFRHYADRGYNQAYYEGFDFKGADPVGIACTSEFSMAFCDEMIPSDQTLAAFSESVSRPAQYVGDPEYYHQLHAFGRWSLPSYETESERWIEDQLDRAVRFYEQEVEQRNWYGMFNYGDFMHTYDRYRHQWRYDMGGYAWDNTELVPTLWLWLYFMRTGREDVFTLAEKLSRHASEVDVYHFGRYQGLGSRHNVRHWGCPCKEARIAMAAHHRFFYYLTGDYRMGEVFEEVKDAEKTYLTKDPLESFYPKEEMVYPSHARSGPDWSSLCADWMTHWERFDDPAYRKKIETGLTDIKAAPLRLISGPDFEFDPESTHLRYIGERAAGGTHLQICMGSPQVWMELAELLGDENFKDMLAEYGWFYYQPRRVQQERSGGLIGEREFSLPFMAATMAAYGAARRKDGELAKTTWAVLLGALMTGENQDGFLPVKVEQAGNQKELTEIPWISTNFTAQWCLNAIMVLEFIRPWLPQSTAEARHLAASRSIEEFHKA